MSFGVIDPLTRESAERIWNRCNKMLQNDPDMTVRGLIRKSNMAFIGTTDDPIDNLSWHKKISADKTMKTKVFPSYRPVKSINILKGGFADNAQLGTLLGCFRMPPFPARFITALSGSLTTPRWVRKSR